MESAEAHPKAAIVSQETANRGIGSKRKLSNSPSEHALKTTSPLSAPRNGTPDFTHS